MAEQIVFIMQYTKFSQAELRTLAAEYKEDLSPKPHYSGFYGVPLAKFIYNLITHQFGEGEYDRESSFSIIESLTTLGYKLSKYENIRNASDLKQRLEREHRGRLADRLGLGYKPAALYGKVDPIAYKYWEDMGGKWDSEGVWGFSASEVDRLWYASGCKINDKFKYLVNTAIREGNEADRYDGVCLWWVKKSHTVNQIKRIRNGLDFLGKRKLPRLSLKNTERIGRVSLPLRYALTKNCTYENPILNYEFASQVQYWTKKEKSKLLSPKEAWWFLYGRCPFEGKNIPHPYPLAQWRKGAGTFAKLVNEFAKYEDGQIKNDMLLPIFNLCCIYGNMNEIKKAVGEFGEWTVKNIHDAGQFILPKGAKWNPKNWKGLCQKSPDVLKYAQYFDKMESDCDALPTSLREVREFASSFIYEGAKGFEDLARYCNEFALTQDQFENYKSLTANPKIAESCPHIDLSIGKYRIYKLDHDDPRGPLLGHYTNCCQHLDSAGAACARHGWNDSTSAFYVIEKDGKIIAQSWAWRSKKSDLVFDSIEGLSGYDYNTIANLLLEGAKNITGRLGIERVLVGDTPYGITKDIRNYLKENTDNNFKKGYEVEMRSPCSYMDGRKQWLLFSTDKKATKFKKKEIVKSESNGCINTLLQGSGVYCEYCEVEVHPDCEICPNCNRDISEWV